MAAVLSEAEVQAQLAVLPEWSRSGEKITLVKTFDGFPSAIAFVNQLVAPAEAAGHHPDLIISHNKVTIHLTTHDAGGLTQQDFDLAHKINRLG